MSTVSVRITDEMKENITEYAKEEKLEQTSEAARKLLAIGIEDWKKKKALELIKSGKITILKGAEIIGMNVWDFTNLIREEGEVWLKNKEFLEEDIKRALR